MVTPFVEPFVELPAPGAPPGQAERTADELQRTRQEMVRRTGYVHLDRYTCPSDVGLVLVCSRTGSGPSGQPLVVLPAQPPSGFVVTIKDTVGAAGNGFAVASPGAQLDGAAAPQVVSNSPPGQAVTIAWDDSSEKYWVVSRA